MVSRDGTTWHADVPGIEGAQTSARTLPALDRRVRDIIVRTARLPDGTGSSLVLDWHFHTGDRVLDDEAARVRALRSRARELADAIHSSTTATARRLVAQRVSVRDAAIMLGVSPQRISQVTRTQPRAS
ncbi:type II toxin-antitoxin system HicB family antitoxin [Actinopolymorpha sp. B11F2]|uniref:type II toxin-antitoxin system HicB family antitoxin n=1 Tax=Actinopolymorpha sp. B11F2 TaxID=3160862 RepID=UPI0032E49C38